MDVLNVPQGLVWINTFIAQVEFQLIWNAKWGFQAWHRAALPRGANSRGCRSKYDEELPGLRLSSVALWSSPARCAIAGWHTVLNTGLNTGEIDQKTLHWASKTTVCRSHDYSGHLIQMPRSKCKSLNNPRSKKWIFYGLEISGEWSTESVWINTQKCAKRVWMLSGTLLCVSSERRAHNGNIRHFVTLEQFLNCFLKWWQLPKVYPTVDRRVHQS